MASTFAVTRNHLIFGLCLPLAVLMGYLLAEPDVPTSLAVILMIAAVLIVPVLMRWYHPLLILSWNMGAHLAFLPGSMQLWAFMSLLGLLFAVINRSVNPDFRFVHVQAITMPLVTLMVVVLATAMATGGIGMRVLGSQNVGGKGYFYLAAAVAGYFALSSQAIPRRRALFYAALFFLPGVLSIVGRLAEAAGPGANFIFLLFPPDADPDSLGIDPSFELGLTRTFGITAVGTAIFCWVLARHGVRGVFNFTRPWRMVILLTAVVIGAFGGFRSAVLQMAIIFIILFSLEKLWRTWIFFVLLIGMTLGGALLVGFADKMPLTVQRSLSFLPLDIDPRTRDNAQDSTQWRLDMWKSVLPQVPQYFWKGKGYNVSREDLYMSFQSISRGFAARWEQAAVAGDYHSGPLSIIIPFGIYGLVAFIWFLVAGTRFLYANFRNSPPELLRINAFLLALFLGRLLFFFLIFGTLSEEFYQFTGILGLGVALNLQPAKPAEAGTLALADASEVYSAQDAADVKS